MKRALCIAAFVILTFFIGRAIANIFMDWPMDMPGWLHYMTMFALRAAGLRDVDNPDDAEVMATLIIVCISWTLTGIVLWLLTRAVRRWWNRRKT
jgi:hypothetical protein